MKATLITIGDEILIGQIVDTNSAFIAQELNAIGIAVHEIISVGDDRVAMHNAFAKAKQQTPIVIITGGLGPTKDDITKSVLCDFFNDTLVFNQSVMDHVTAIFKEYVKVEMAPMNKNQAWLPSKAVILKNEYGTAPGMLIREDGVIFINMPGVPFEMKELMRSQVLPILKKEGNLPFIHHRTILTAGQGESTIATRIEQWENNLPEHIKLAYLPSFGTVRLRLSTQGYNELLVKSEVQQQLDVLYTLIPDIILGESNKNSIAHTVCALLKEKGITVATAESLTGGKIANVITAIPGASSIFKGSTVTYATQSKIDVLNVDPEIIAKYSVVSKQVAEMMAQGVLKLFKADIAVSTTGNAGPDKGDSDAAVGTVCIAIATASEVISYEFMMGNHRERVVEKSVNKAFELLYEKIMKIGAI